MIEEITAGLTYISDIDTALSMQMSRAVVNLDRSVNETMPVIAQLLNITRTEVSDVEHDF